MIQARPYLFVVAVCVMFAALTVQLMRMQDLNWGHVFADPAEVGRYPVYTGLFTYLGILALAITAAVLAFAARRLAPLERDEVTERHLLGLAALLSTLLAIDDLFQFHEYILRSAFGIHEALVYAVFAVIGLVILLVAGRRCVTAEFTGFWIAAVLLVVSLFADLLEDRANPSAIQLLVEEVSKFCGLTVWLVFWWRFAGSALDRNATAQTPAGTRPTDARRPPVD